MHLDNIYFFTREFYNYICIFKQLLYFFDDFKSICFLNDKFLFRFSFEFILKILCYKVISIVYFIVLSRYIIIKILIDSIFLNFILDIFFYTFTIWFRDLHSIFVLRNFLIQIEIVLRLLFCFRYNFFYYWFILVRNCDLRYFLN